MKVRQSKNGTYFIKKGMTSVIAENGSVIPVTVLERVKNTILGEKDDKILCVFHGYKKKFNKPQIEMLNKLNKSEKSEDSKENNKIMPLKGFIREIDIKNQKEEINLNFFNENDFIDVSSLSKGKGFQGGMKRHNFHGQPASHGCSLSHRVIGSTGNRHLPSRTFKGRKMPGHMGHEMTTQQNLKIVRVMENYDVLLVKGSVPGPNKTLVFVRKSLKKGVKNAK